MTNTATISLPASLKIDTVEEFRGQLNSVIESGNPVTLDGTALSSIDYSGVQLLMIFSKAMAESELGVTWQNPGECLQTALRDLNAAALVGSA